MRTTNEKRFSFSTFFFCDTEKSISVQCWHCRRSIDLANSSLSKFTIGKIHNLLSYDFILFCLTYLNFYRQSAEISSFSFFLKVNIAAKSSKLKETQITKRRKSHKTTQCQSPVFSRERRATF